MLDDKIPQIALPTTKETIHEALKIALPAIVTMISALFVEVINTAFVGHLGDESMVAGVGMGNMYMNILAMSIAQGLSSTLNTLVSQSYGQKNYHLCGVYLNRARIIVTVLYVPTMIVMLNAERVFLLMGFEAMSSHYSQLYITRMIPGAYAMNMYDADRRFLQNMGY